MKNLIKLQIATLAFILMNINLFCQTTLDVTEGQRRDGRYVIYYNNAPDSTFIMELYNNQYIRFNADSFFLKSLSVPYTRTVTPNYVVTSDDSGQVYTNTYSSFKSGLGIPTKTSDLTNDAGFINSIPTVTSHTVNRTITSSSGTNTYTISSSQATVYYNISISCTASIGSASSATVALQYSIDNGSTWITLQEAINSNTVTLSLALNSVTVQCTTICGVIPAGAKVQLLQSTAGTVTVTYKRGQEVY